MRIPFVEIPPEGIRCDISDVSWFPAHEVDRIGPLKATVFLQRKAARVLVSGSISVTFLFDCDRCLGRFELPSSLDFKLDVEFADPTSLAREHTCSHSEMDTMFVAEPVIDVHGILRQQVLLSVPEKKLCAEECRGLCMRCGADLNQGPCGCDRQEKITPFSVLKDLAKG
ncbi:MAG: hypothetical protein AUK28_07865 [Desulfobacterales bacterium CG2_30_60_27]|nr:MAG: hypothetical protein AUK28_07865 [Desulfobacterales bacterium CG2_30_60_27]